MFGDYLRQEPRSARHLGIGERKVYTELEQFGSVYQTGESSGRMAYQHGVTMNRQAMLTIREASRVLHVHSNTLRRWSDQGIVKAYRIGPRGDRRFRPEDVAAMLLEQQVPVVK